VTKVDEKAQAQLVMRLEGCLNDARDGKVHQAFVCVELEGGHMKVYSMTCKKPRHLELFLDRVMDAVDTIIDEECTDEPENEVKLNG
jgi:hypothetical protein